MNYLFCVAIIITTGVHFIILSAYLDRKLNEMTEILNEITHRCRENAEKGKWKE